MTVFAAEKSVAEGSFVPLLPKFNPHLGAPYVANWNDFPVIDEPLLFVGGTLSRFIGLFAATNALVLAAHVLAGLSLFAVCRALRYRWQWSFAAALAFALAPYAFQRGLSHLNLTYYWHVPLGLLVCWWCAARDGVEIRSRRFWFGLAVALVTGVSNVYYTNMFLQFLGFAALAQAVRRNSWRRVATPIVLGGACFSAFLAMNVDTLYHRAVHGKNSEVAHRMYEALEIYALKPLDLFIPPGNHRLEAAREFRKDYQLDKARRAYVRGEGPVPYLGLAGIGALLCLALVCASRSLREPRQPLPVEALGISWIVLFSVIGGVNGFLGQLGLTLFRCTNRFSIHVLALSLLFGARALTRVSASWRPSRVNAGMLLLVGLICWDQLPLQKTAESLARTEMRVSSDRAFTAAMEDALPPSAMVFQLPVMPFPESWPIHQMTDYEHLRPYLYSTDLHFSYGSDKGRAREKWQDVAARQPVPELVATLERAGFAALYINRKGYPDGGAALLTKLREAGRTTVIESPAGDLVCVLLHPAVSPELPQSPPYFSAGWYGEEGNAQGDTWHYSKGDAEIVLFNTSSHPQSRRFSFQLASPSPRTVEIWVKDRMLYRSPDLSFERVSHSLTLSLAPGETTLTFKTQAPVTFPHNPDTRLLGFLLYNPRLEVAPDGA